MRVFCFSCHSMMKESKAAYAYLNPNTCCCRVNYLCQVCYELTYGVKK